MKHLWALSSTLVLSLALIISGVAAWGAEPSADKPSAEARAAASLVPTVAAHGFYWQLISPQDVVSGVHLIARGQAHRAAKGTRSDRQFFEISSTGSNDVPEAALRAYQRAEMVMATTDPDCQISWTLLAAIGRVESNHGRFGGAQLGSDGVSRPEIRGPRLDGAGPFAAIADTDKGTLDRDKLWDRAVGQMQFLPETWRSVARDGDGDGVKNPDDLDDSALGAAVYLCGVGGSLADAAGVSRAAFRYNHSDYYVQLVLAMQAGYLTGVFTEPSPPPPPVTPAQAPRAPEVTKPRTTKPRSVGKPKIPAAAPKPAPRPTPKPTPKPTPTPAAPQRVQLEGTWSNCPGGGFCVAGTALDLGPLDRLDDVASADFDADGSVETNFAEFTGLVGKHVVLKVERNPLGAVVFLINGLGFRNDDSSFARSAPTSSATSATAAP